MIIPETVALGSFTLLNVGVFGAPERTVQVPFSVSGSKALPVSTAVVALQISADELAVATVGGIPTVMVT